MSALALPRVPTASRCGGRAAQPRRSTTSRPIRSSPCGRVKGSLRQRRSGADRPGSPYQNGKRTTVTRRGWARLEVLTGATLAVLFTIHAPAGLRAQGEEFQFILSVSDAEGRPVADLRREEIVI